MSGDSARDICGALLATGPPAEPGAKGRLGCARLKSPPVPVLVACFAAPHSYTGEDVVELQAPGHPALLDRLLHRAVEAGARLAEPGEFTFRAYTAGKLDLTRAEGVAATIAATSDGQLKAASLLREGKLGALATELVDALGAQLALVEAGIDFVDQEDVVPIPPGELDANLAKIQQRLSTLLARSRSWGAIEALPRVVLVGPPSSGKSTLFNALLGRERAVVDPVPGTTRDVLEEPLSLTDEYGRRVEVMLVDIAGLDRPEAVLDAQVQATARRAIGRADLILRIDDETSNDDTPTLRIHTKADLGPGPGLNVSAVTGENLDGLRAAIAQRLGGRGVSVASDMLALQPRHESALRAALDAVTAARQLLAPQRERHAIDNVEHVAGHLRHALDELAMLGGELTPDDVIGRVFATFCVGK